MNYKEKIEDKKIGIILIRLISNWESEKSPENDKHNTGLFHNAIEELTALIEQERESAVREFVGWIQGQAHGYKALVHMPVNQAHIQVREVYELLEQFISEQNNEK